MTLVRSLVVCLLLAAGLLMSGSGPVLAVDDGQGQIGVSRDGVHWTDDIRAPLFDPAFRWVPGDQHSERFYVRNQSTDGGDLTVTVERTSTDGLAGTGFLHISARAGNGAWHSVDDAVRHQLARVADIPPGVVVPVDLRVSLDFRAPNRTMILASHLGLQIGLTESAATNGSAPGHGGSLPNTGSPVRPWLVVLASSLLLSGFVLTRCSARRSPPPSSLPEPPT